MCFNGFPQYYDAWKLCSTLFLTCFSLCLSFSLAPMKYESQISNIHRVGTGFTASPFLPFVCLGMCRFQNYLSSVAD